MAYDKICVIGLGYIGLPAATLLARAGANVLGCDVSSRVVDCVNAGKLHIVEPGLDALLAEVVAAGRLKAALEPAEADAFILAVPTPFKEGHKPDLSYIDAAATSAAPFLRKGSLVILESTSPAGTTERLAKTLAALRPDLTFPINGEEEADVQVAHCPERVLPGQVVRELVENDRIIGGLSKKAARMAAELYSAFVIGEMIATDAKTAEMCKLTENSFRDVNIAFANELSVICDKMDIDVWELIELANRHPRVNILRPGCGVGGHCIAVDPWFIVDGAPEEAKIIGTARNVNDAKPRWVIERVKAAIADYLAKWPEKKIGDVKIACLGLAFKPDIDDLRESPAIEVAAALAALGAKILAVEPNIKTAPAALRAPNVVLTSLADALNEGDIVVILTPHKEFIDVDWQNFTKTIVDPTGITRRRA